MRALFGPLVAAGIKCNCNCCVCSLSFSLSLLLSEDLGYFIVYVTVGKLGFPQVPTDVADVIMQLQLKLMYNYYI